MITRDELNEVLEYRNGILYWRLDGSVAGSKNLGRWVVYLNCKHYLRSRLVYIMHNGQIPEGYDIDHIDRVTDNDKIENLRCATHSENMCNIGKRKHNKSGVKGVSWDKKNSKWVAHVSINKKLMHLGYFDDKKEAKMIYEMAATLGHGQFANFD